VQLRSSLVDIYRDLHRNPELSFQEKRTAGIVAEHLREVGAEVTEGVGRTGVVGVLRRGDGPTVLLRADMDALPVAEDTGLEYASTARGVDRDGNDVPVAHACGHDVHVTCLLGAVAALAADDAWKGTVLAVFQPAEEVGGGAQAMIDDGLYARFGRPDVVLGQHVAPLPAGVLALRPGPAFAASDTVRITLHGEGGHGSRPETTVDPVVMAASTVMRLQTVVSREVSATDTAVVTVGTLHAGTKENVIADRAELGLTVRSFDPSVRERVLAAIERIVRAEAAASRAPREPEIRVFDGFPPLVNDEAAAARTQAALETVAPVVEPGLVTGSEDVGQLATAAGVPCVYWLLGGADQAHFARAESREDLIRIIGTLPSNHSPRYAPVEEPTVTVGVSALVAAAKDWLRATE
jgi:amidohydrolase